MPKENVVYYKTEIPKITKHEYVINMLGKKFGFGAKKINEDEYNSNQNIGYQKTFRAHLKNL